MITVQLARDLLAAGVLWQPQPGDRFVIDTELLTEDVFWISHLTVEVHHYGGQSVLGFNGTTEWALDSVALEDALWLPHEHQLRELLRGSFRALRRLPDTHEVEIVLGRGGDSEEVLVFEHPEPADAYAMAVRELLLRIA